MKRVLFFIGTFISIGTFAQKEAPKNWQLMDPKVDKTYGTGAEEAYKALKDKKSKQIIVAVIDSGVEEEHEDLKSVIWTNPGEIADNGIDDDKNGYADDVHGWNFMGGKNGDIDIESTELARMYHRLKIKYNKYDDTNLTPDESKAYEEYKKIRTIFLAEQTKQQQQLSSVVMVEEFLDKIKKSNNGVINKDALNKYKPVNEIETKMKKGIKLAITFGVKPEEITDQITAGKKQLQGMLDNNNLNADSLRQYIVGDDINNPNERYYGNNHLKGLGIFGSHGTHCAGIIAAVRNNNLGLNGIADNVKIMILRAVPNGDERDKDIANSIRYAVDNGATIISMSFGKYYSPDKKVVDEAVEYAASKDVLLLHAAGNESKNKDAETSFPSRVLLNGTTASNWIEVGANSYKSGSKLIGSFSNYGKTTVDLFAPGVEIYSTVLENKYEAESGTSMACPAAAGVAAIIRSYFPELKANEVRELLMKTVVRYKKSVTVPGSQKEKKAVGEMCISGGFISANNAVKELLGLNKKK